MPSKSYDSFTHIASDGRDIGVERESIDGFFDDKTITVDDRIERGSKKELGVYLHELIHVEFNELSEERVLEIERSFMDFMWTLGYRRHPVNPPMPAMEAEPGDELVFSHKVE